MRRVMAARDVRVHLSDLPLRIRFAERAVKGNGAHVSRSEIWPDWPGFDRRRGTGPSPATTFPETPMANKSKAEMLDSLRVLLREVLALRSAGSTHPRLSRASGVVDGYMRVLLDAGLVSQRELLAVVAEERSA